MISKDYFEKQIKKHSKVTIYSADSIALALTKVPCIRCDNGNMADFAMDCSDLTKYCNRTGLALKPNNKN